MGTGDADEEGVDQGGVKKEFFQLLTREIFNEVSIPFLASQASCLAQFHNTLPAIHRHTAFLRSMRRHTRIGSAMHPHSVALSGTLFP